MAKYGNSRANDTRDIHGLDYWYEQGSQQCYADSNSAYTTSTSTSTTTPAESFFTPFEQHCDQGRGVRRQQQELLTGDTTFSSQQRSLGTPQHITTTSTTTTSTTGTGTTPTTEIKQPRAFAVPSQFDSRYIPTFLPPLLPSGLQGSSLPSLPPLRNLYSMTNLANTTATATTTTTTTTTATTTLAANHTSGNRPRNRPSISHLPRTPSRQRSRTPGTSGPASGSGSGSGSGYWHLPTPQPFEPANEWGNDLVSQNLMFSADASGAGAGAGAGSAPNPLLFSDENFLNALAENEFSSPSTYPSFTNLPPHLILPRPDFQAASSLSSSSSSSSGTVGPSPPSVHPIHPSAYNENTLPPSSRILNHSFNSAFDADSHDTSQHTTITIDSLNEDDSVIPASPDTIISDTMPRPMPSGRVRSAAARPSSNNLPSAKRRRTSHGSDHLRRSPRLFSHAATATATAPATTIATNGDGVLNEPSLFCDTDDELFGESPTRPAAALDLTEEDFTTIDLTEVTEVPEELKKPDEDNRIKLSAFQCVICMDDVTTLTVTHCGHLYCAQCLHSSLNVEATKGKCPMCRTKIDMKPRDHYTSKTKGFWPLELKLMTATRKGKRKADALS